MSRAYERPPFGLAMGSLLRADSIVVVRSGISTIVSLLLPVVLVVATSFNTKAQTRLGGAAELIGIALTIGLLVSGLLGYSLAVAHDRESGVLQRLRVTPVATWMIMTSRLCVQEILNLVIAVVVVVAAVIAYGLNLNGFQIALVLLVALLGGGVFLSIAQALVAIVKTVSAVNALNRIVLIAFVLLGLLGTSGILGDTIQVIAEWSPVGVVTTLFSDAVAQNGWAAQDTYSLPMAFAYIIVFTFIGIRWFRWQSH
ncbi:ABC transporter permease [Rathayibacter soli]|uniref:ABC transporter permease n=1 Tax=Rathayibacter soli TaxID=3144168 RepID=UPI0027E5187E|nr:ABC transporter permease [Glaciibacter superstes]